MNLLGDLRPIILFQPNLSHWILVKIKNGGGRYYLNYPEFFGRKAGYKVDDNEMSYLKHLSKQKLDF